jgi:two-component system phosphate regulon sensor histidine kinase PhoR
VSYSARLLTLTTSLLLLTLVVLVLVAEFALPGRLPAGLSPEQAELAVRAARRGMMLAVLIAAIPGGILAWAVARAMTRPLREAEQAVQRFAGGEPPRFPHSGSAETARLLGALRSMHEGIEARFAALQRGQAEAEALVNAMVEGVVACDDTGRVTTANPAARRLLGYPGDSPLPDLPVLFRQKLAREAVAAALRGETSPDREVEFDERTCLLSARGLPGGGAVVVLHDLTELRKLEAVRRDFVTNVSHELKTPLTSIAGYAETLLADAAEGSVARRFLETILQNARRMQELVDDQLDLSRIESGHWRPVPQPVRAEPLIREAWEPFETASRGTLAFQVTVEPGAESFAVDPEALRQVLGNLFENARRHTPAGGTVTTRLAPDGGGVRLTVRDTGSGISGEHLPRIFERFYRADPARSRAGGGSGLGLAIVKHLVEAHGGRVWATSALGEGTTIACWFPQGAPLTWPQRA